MYLLAPKPTTGQHFCGRTIWLSHRLSLPFNCDSAEFVRDAILPRRLLEHNSWRQDRPALVAAAAILTRVLMPFGLWRILPAQLCAGLDYCLLRPVPQELCVLGRKPTAIKFHGHSLSKAQRVQYVVSAYIAYILINFISLLTALIVFHWLNTARLDIDVIVIALPRF